MKSGRYALALTWCAVSATVAAMVMLMWAVIVVSSDVTVVPLREEMSWEPAPRHIPEHPMVGEVVHLPEALPPRL